MGKAALARVKSIAAELQSLRKIPKRYHVDLETRCIIMWGKPGNTPHSAYGARERKVASREKQAQATYSDVQDENCHILLPFMLAMSPRACERFVEMQEMIAEHSTLQLNLGIESKELLEGMAVKNEFNKNPDYITCIESLFPVRVSEPSICQQTESVDDFVLIRKIIKQRGLLENPTCVKFLSFMFPDKHQSLNEYSPNNHLTVHAVVAGSPKRKRARTDNVYPEYTPDATDSPGPERSNALKRGRLLDAPPKTNADARQKFTASPATSTSCTNTPPNEMQSEPTATSEISVDNLSSTTVQQHVVLENASLQGIADVFDNYIYGAISRVTVQIGGNPSLKAAVTMDFPRRGLVDCLMSLAIQPSKVGYLAMALFKIQVESVGEIRYVSLKGVRMTHNPEIILKGVLDEAIIDVLGSEIHRAVTACRMRKKELEEGNRKTECVSMILTSSSDEAAIINLSLGVEEGTQIREKLYT